MTAPRPNTAPATLYALLAPVRGFTVWVVTLPRGEGRESGRRVRGIVSRPSATIDNVQ